MANVLIRAYPVRDFLSIENNETTAATVRTEVFIRETPLFRTEREKGLTINDFRFEGLHGLMVKMVELLDG